MICPVSDPASLVSASRELRGKLALYSWNYDDILSFLENELPVILEQLIYFISMVSYREMYKQSGWEIVDFIREVLFQIHLDEGCPNPDPKWFIPDPAKKVSDPTPDPDPQHWFLLLITFWRYI